MSDAERKLADECYSGIRHGLESYHTVRAKWYAKDGDWVKNLERALDNIINKDNKDFMESALTPSTRLSIRIVDKARQAEVEAYIRQRLASVGYSAADAKAIMERVRFIPVAIGPEIRSLDPALDLLVDVGTMECDRYISGTYEGAPPPALRDGFLALLKIATNNMSEEILRGNIEEILKKIFTSGLVAKPINWKSIDEQNRANRQLSIAA